MNLFSINRLCIQIKVVCLHHRNGAIPNTTTMTTSQIQSFAAAKKINLIIEVDELETFYGINYGRGNKYYWFSIIPDTDRLFFEYVYNNNTGERSRLFSDNMRMHNAIEKFLSK